MSFQSTAFQNSGFQTGVVTPTPTPTRAVGGVGKKKRRIYVKIDDEIFEVATQAEAERLLAQARDIAVATAERVAAKALAKVSRARTPAAKRRAESLPLPQIEIGGYDGMEAAQEFVQQLRAQVDQANVQIAAIYARALELAQQQAETDAQDAVDVGQLIAMDADEDERLVQDILDVRAITKLAYDEDKKLIDDYVASLRKGWKRE